MLKGSSQSLTAFEQSLTQIDSKESMISQTPCVGEKKQVPAIQARAQSTNSEGKKGGNSGGILTRLLQISQYNYNEPKHMAEPQSSQKCFRLKDSSCSPDKLRK